MISVKLCVTLHLIVITSIHWKLIIIFSQQVSSFSGEVYLEGSELLDTFLDTTGWSKGFLLVNGQTLGRYWPEAGPQYTLYIPGNVTID